MRLSSDGYYLDVTKTNKHAVDIYVVDDLEENPTTIGGTSLRFNLPQGSEIADGHLFIADTGNNYVYIWEDVEDALAGKSADMKLGQGVPPQIGTDTLFWPATPSYDGSYLLLGEVKFSGRFLRFSPEE